MIRYILKRVLFSLVTIWIIISITFVLMHSIPGDPFSNQKRLKPEMIEKAKEKYGLDKPIYEQYIIYLKNILKGDLGISLINKNKSVNKMLKDGFSVSAKVGLCALLVANTIGILFGVIASLNRGKSFDYFVIFLAIIGVSVPGFVFATLFQYIFGLKLKILPIARWGTVSHYVLPVLSLAFTSIAYVARMMRTSMLDVLGQDYIKTAKAKGLTKRKIIGIHAMKNAILPIVTITGVATAGILMGSFVIEKIFSVPGMGKFLINAIQQKDYTVILGTTVFYSIFLVICMLLIDIVYVFIDPRIKLK